MKRIAPLFFLSIFLFNLIGYYCIYLGLRHRADRELTQKLDAEAYVNPRGCILLFQQKEKQEGENISPLYYQQKGVGYRNSVQTKPDCQVALSYIKLIIA